jgi:rod shape-determining protein MreC
MKYKGNNPLKSYLLLFAILIFGSLILFQTMKRAVYKLYSDFFYPYMAAPSAIGNSLKNKSLLLKSKFSLASTVEELQLENEKLSARTAAYQKLENENDELRKLLKLKKRKGYKCIFAEIILRDPVLWEENFTINKGLKNGVTIGSTVLTTVPSVETGRPTLAVIGRVWTVSDHSAIVVTILNRECRMSVKLPESSAAGIISGGARYGDKVKAMITYLPKGMDYKPGEPVYTSGMSEYTAPSLFVGKLSDDKSDATVRDNLYSEAVLEPAADFENIRFVMVMIKEKDKK